VSNVPSWLIFWNSVKNNTKYMGRTYHAVDLVWCELILFLVLLAHSQQDSFHFFSFPILYKNKSINIDAGIPKPRDNPTIAPGGEPSSRPPLLPPLLVLGSIHTHMQPSHLLYILLVQGPLWNFSGWYSEIEILQK